MNPRYCKPSGTMWMSGRSEVQEQLQHLRGLWGRSRLVDWLSRAPKIGLPHTSSQDRSPTPTVKVASTRIAPALSRDGPAQLPSPSGPVTTTFTAVQPASTRLSPTNPSTVTRKRDASTAGLDSYIPAISQPGIEGQPSVDQESEEEHDDQQHSTLLNDEVDENGRKRPVKRACNECRQQKLRCDVVQDPWVTCSRCRRLNLECKIEQNFKRIGKRSRNAEMEREIIELRKQVVEFKRQQRGYTMPTSLIRTSAQGTVEAANVLADLKDGVRGGSIKRLGDVTLPVERVKVFFERFFKFSHPFLPFLNADRSPDEYYARSPLLFWTIIMVGSRHYNAEQNLFGALAEQVKQLTWATIAEIPQNYHVVKALVLICAWPFPCSSTSTDPTFMLAGMMMQIAMQIGLHRPDHAQDFSKFKLELRQAELQDRVTTWAVCNIVAQRVATAYGQPPSTLYDWTLGPRPIESNPSYELPPEIYSRLQIERFVDKVTKTLYVNANDPEGLPDDTVRSQLVRILSQDLDILESRFEADQSEIKAITKIYLKSAALHLHLSAFFSHRKLPTYRTDMLGLYHATINLLEACLTLESEYSINLPTNYSHGLSLSHGTNYVFHMMLAAGFSLLKLMNHFLPQHNLDIQGAEQLLNRTLWALRSASVLENDLPERLAEVLAQVWKIGKAMDERDLEMNDTGAEDGSDSGSDELQLKVRCRMSMSLVFDSVWRWRKRFRDQRPPGSRFFATTGPSVPTDPIVAQAALDIQQPNSIPTTLPLDHVRTDNSALAAPSIPTSTRAPSLSALANPNATTNAGQTTTLTSGTTTPNGIPGMAGMPTGIADEFSTDPYGSMSGVYDVFDPLNWMLDGTVDFPFSFHDGGQGRYLSGDV